MVGLWVTIKSGNPWWGYRPRLLEQAGILLVLSCMQGWTFTIAGLSSGGLSPLHTAQHKQVASAGGLVMFNLLHLAGAPGLLSVVVSIYPSLYPTSGICQGVLVSLIKL